MESIAILNVKRKSDEFFRTYAFASFDIAIAIVNAHDHQAIPIDWNITSYPVDSVDFSIKENL